jgi:hypothetical protein
VKTRTRTTPARRKAASKTSSLPTMLAEWVSAALVPAGSTAGLHHHHRLGIGRGTQRAHEAARVADAFHVDQDALRAGVMGQEVQHLRQVDGGVRPQRHHRREADAVVPGPVEDGGGERARLRHQRQRAGGGQRAQRAGVELELRPLEAQAVGAQQVHAVAARDQVQFGAQRSRQAAGQHQRGAAADAADDLERRGDLLGRQRDQRQVGARMGQVRQRAGHVDVQPVQLADVAAVLQFPPQRGGHRRGRLGGVGGAGEDDDRLRGEQRSEDVAVHGGNLRRRRVTA